MPSKFWKSSSSQSINSDPALDHPSRSQSRQDPAHAPRPPSQPSYNPYAQESTASLTSSSSKDFAHSIESQQAPTSQEQTTIGGQPYEQHYQAQIAQPETPLASKKSIKARFFAASAATREDSSHKKESGLFGRQKSVVKRQDALPTQKQDSSLSNANNGQWQHDPRQAPQPQQQQQQHQQFRDTRESFVPFSPDFTQEQLEPPPHLQQQPVRSDSLGLSQAHTQYSPTQRNPTSYPGSQKPFSDRISGSTGTYTPPTRPSFESLQQPPSAIDPNSRPHSGQSYESRPEIQQNSPYRYASESALGEAQYSPTNPHYQGRPGGIVAYRPSDLQQQQQQPQQPTISDPANMSKLNAQTGLSREPQHNLHTDTPIQADRNNGSGLSPNPAMSGPSPLVNRGPQPLREGEMGRRTPPPIRTTGDMTEVDVAQLSNAHRELSVEYEIIRKKYQNVKRQFYQQKEQVDMLQNTLAHQRISQSRTHLDDGEYIKRLTRLDGLVNQLAYVSRKQWSRVPEWLVPFVSADAVQEGKKEIIIVSRAFASRWLTHEVFDKYFHPDLDATTSAQLKTIQKNIRLSAPIPQSVEDEENLTAKINTWRLTTIDGLRPILSSPQAAVNRKSLIETLSSQLLEDYMAHQEGPPIIDVKNGIPDIIELAVSILANLPQESRDVHIEYFMPGSPIYEDVMRIETGLPPLVGMEADQTSTAEYTESTGQEKASGETGKASDESIKRGLFSGLKPKKTASGPTSKLNVPGQQGASAGDEDEPGRVRMCVFPAMQIRGKMVLAKAPVYKF